MTIDEFKELIKPEAINFLEENLDAEAGNFALKHSGNNNLPIRAIAEQIALRKKTGIKFPKLSRQGFLFDKEAFEQSSGELAAAYKKRLISGKRIIDITGGLGIDLLFLSENFEESIYCERSEILCELFRYNSGILQTGIIEILEGDSIKHLERFPDDYFDWLYADPARREQGRRSVDLNYCSPNVIEHMDLFFKKSANVLLKLSPAFELSEAVKIFPNLSKFLVVSVDGECKETLLALHKRNTGKKVKIKAVLLNSEGTQIELVSFVGKTLKRNIAQDITGYFYEPDAAIIKARLTAQLAAENNLKFINKDSDYLVSADRKNGFPGRSFHIMNVWEYKPKQIIENLKTLGIEKANIARRSFPLSPEEIRSKLKLREGGSAYLFFTQNSEEKLICIYCEKIK